MLAAGVAAVFMYHHVLAVPPAGRYARALSVSPREFESQLRALRNRGCSMVGVGRIIADVRAGRGRPCEVALTFDDGYSDAADVAEPLLTRYGAVATFFVTTRSLDSPGHLTKVQIGKLARDGMEIGAHSVTHVDLTTIGPRAAAVEARDSRVELRAISGQPVEAFAYPAGRFNANVEDAVRNAGFSAALATNAGDLTAGALDRDIYAIPRYRILRGQGLALMAGLLARPNAAEPAMTEAELHGVARSRIAGNAPDIAERVAVALLAARFPEPIVKVRVLKTAPAVVAGIVLSGVKFHETLDRRTFAADVSEMIYRAFAADSSIGEVDVWTVTPISVPRGSTVAGDLAVPTTRTVFSASLLRSDWERDPSALGITYWDPRFLQDGIR